MTLWDHHSASEATGGVASGQWQASRVEIDTRRLQRGDLFVAIKGERFDGHAFSADALARGAAAVVLSHRPADLPADAPVLLVADTLRALEDLGRFARRRTKARVVGVTGSVGKTSSKEMLKLALSAHGKTYASSGNFNNHIGTPLNLANLPLDTDFAVFEMGMNHAGEIAHLTQMVQPHIAVITNVESVHLEFFDSQEAIADAKAEIFEGMPSGGVAVLNADNAHINRLKMAAARCGISQVLTFGEAPEAMVRLVHYWPAAKGCRIEANVRDKKLLFDMGALGKHWAKTALIALSVGYALSLNDEKTARALSGFSEPQGRGKLVAIAVQGGEAILIDDSYNAGPASMKAALAKTIEVWEGAKRAGRTIAVLGEMLELGESSGALHAALAEDIAGQFDRVYLSGALMKHLHDALPDAVHVSEAKALLPLLAKELRAGDIVLLKGSHGSKIYEVAQALMSSGEKKHAV